MKDDELDQLFYRNLSTIVDSNGSENIHQIDSSSTLIDITGIEKRNRHYIPTIADKKKKYQFPHFTTGYENLELETATNTITSTSNEMQNSSTKERCSSNIETVENGAYYKANKY